MLKVRVWVVGHVREVRNGEEGLLGCLAVREVVGRGGGPLALRWRRRAVEMARVWSGWAKE